MSKSNAEKAAILDRETGKSPSATRYLALFTTSPSDAGGGTEVTGGSYVRRSTTAADWNAASTTTGTTSNATALAFAQATASWGTPTHWALMDAASAGTILRWGPISSPQAVPSGATLRFPAGALVLTETGSGVTTTTPLATDSQWRRKLGTVSGTDVFYDGASSDKTQWVADQIAKERAAGSGPWVATYNSTSYTWIAAPDTPLRKIVTRTDIAASWRKPLEAVLSAVPIDDAWFTTYNPPDQGEDSMLTVYQPSTDRLWELFWFRRKNGPGASGTLPGGDPDWLEAPYYNGADSSAYGSCHWGGATENASRSFGVYNYASWPPHSKPIWGGTAGSHIFVAGLITMAELAAGVIPHAIAVDFGRMRSGVVTLPAHRSDGLNMDQYAPNYGAHYRLAPEVDLDAITFATPFAKMIAKAMQDYGIIARNQTGGATTFFCEDPTPSNQRGMFWDQVTGLPAASGYFQGLNPPAALDGIPWSSLLLIESFELQTPNVTMAIRGDFGNAWRTQSLERLVGKNPAATRYLALFTTSPRRDNANLPGIEVGGAVRSANTTSGSATIVVSSPNTLVYGGTIVAGQAVAGPGIPAGATVLSVAGSNVTLSANASATQTGVMVKFGGAFGYSRVATTAADWRSAFTTSAILAEAVGISNINAKSFPAATASWGKPEAWGLFDAADLSGNLLAFGTIPPLQRTTVTTGKVATIPVDGATVQDMAASVYSGLSVA